MGRKDTLAYKRSLDSGSEGLERKIKKGIGHKVGKRTLFSNITNNLPQFRKKERTEETVMPGTSGYNLRPRRGAKVESRPTNEKMIQEGDQFESKEVENISAAPTSESKQGQQVGRPEADVVNNSIARRREEERADGPNLWRV
ncbi:uncharacterized protein TNCV_1911151 [Trichonephila clavipes]|nr:uncharacterized protein TNCV_1911151 [Trichonephila clavipes]